MTAERDIELEASLMGRSILALVKQGGPGMDREDMACVYYNKISGRGCAVGVLIKDRDLAVELAGSWSNLEGSTRHRMNFEKLCSDQPELQRCSFLLELMQMAHDDAALSTDSDTIFFRLLRDNFKMNSYLMEVYERLPQETREALDAAASS